MALRTPIFSATQHAAPFETNTRRLPNRWSGRYAVGWQQFVYNPASGPSTGSDSIQYWLLIYGPSGTSCPTPRGANCSQGGVWKDGWCPQPLPNDTNVYCAVNAKMGAKMPAEPITSLQDLEIWAAVAGEQGTNDKIFVAKLGTFYNAPGDNYFPDLGNHCQRAEFNVFGDGGGNQAIFNSGSTVVVGTVVYDGVNISAPVYCRQESFTAETNNLTLVGSPAAALVGAGKPQIVFTESRDGGGQTVCTPWLVPLMAHVLGGRRTEEGGLIFANK